MPINNNRKKVSYYDTEQKEDEIVFGNMVNQANEGTGNLILDFNKAFNANKLYDYFRTIIHLYPKDQYKEIAFKITDTYEITDKSQIPPPNQKKESKDKNKIIEDVKEMIKNTETKKKKKHSSDINVTQEYDKLLNDLDQLQKTKKKRKMIDEVTSMLDIPKIKKTSKKSKIIDDTFDMLSDIPKIKKTSKKSKVIDDTFDMLSNIPRVKKSSSKKTKEIGDTLISMMDTQLSKPPKKEPISIDNIVSDIDKAIKQKKSRSKRAKISEKVSDLLSTPQPEIKDTKTLSKASKQAKSIIDDIDNFYQKKTQKIKHK